MNVTIRRILLIVLILGGSIAIAMRLKAMKEPPRHNPDTASSNLTTSVIFEPDTLKVRVPISGRVVARDKITVIPEVTGKLTSGTKPFKEGNRFSKGEVLMQLDASDAKMGVVSQRSTLQSNLTLLLADIKIDYPSEFKTWETYIAHLDPTSTLQSLPEVKEAGLKNLLVAKGVYQFFYQIRSSEAQLRKFTILAPFNGIVTSANVTEGEVIRAGQPIGNFLRTDSYEMEVGLSLDEKEKIGLGDEILLTSTDREGEWKGKVSRISNAIDPATQTVKVYLNVTGEGLYDGLYLSGDVHAGEAVNVMRYPSNLLISENGVFVIEDGKLVKKEVDIIHREPQSVLMAGLDPGTVLIGKVVPGAYEGMQVSIIKE